MVEKILILTESFDNTADKVCQWLNYFNQAYLRINTDLDEVWVHHIELKNNRAVILLAYKGGIIDLDKLNLIWFRRGKLVNTIPYLNNGLSKNENIDEQINQHIKAELIALNEFIYHHIPQKVQVINNPIRYNINKLVCLFEAARLGLKTPDTLLTPLKSVVRKAVEVGPMITKNIAEILICHTDTIFFSQGTELVTQNELNKSTDTFFMSLFQTAIKKRADIRVFFLFEEVFATSVFNTSEPTSYDIRGSQNKTILPYNLPMSIKKKLLKLARIMNLESGSADMVLSTDGSLYFLEINPVGQVDNISGNANLYVEKFIARKLSEYA